MNAVLGQVVGFRRRSDAELSDREVKYLDIPPFSLNSSFRASRVSVNTSKPQLSQESYSPS
ncbi:hypothetical protein H6F50_07840 [Coleofasciculus sp. FACHB-712]|uniref:hypothetical protein n=1 Tax=Cyanophyceae TaxID=3028117 RepID=UPI0016848EB6|nr:MULTISPECIES: hypothetical protein [unclassified Coleofasciculus]MBD1942267.1 hypothetical protein [Coleofasciculus sp. FACHB-712]